MLVKYCYQQHDNCPQCGALHESTSHLMQCQGTGVNLVWDEELCKHDEWMNKQNLHPEIRTIILDYLRSWHNQSTPTFIGHLQFLQGFWSHNFDTCFKVHLNNLNSLQSSQLLLSKTQRQIWMVAWALWEHRNKFLHDRNKSFHPQEINEIHRDFAIEWNNGLDGLLTKYASLLSKPLPHLLNQSNVHKFNWLTMKEGKRI